MDYTMLVVDDEMFIRRTIARRMRMCGRFNVLESANGAEAIEIIDAQQVDALLLDICMDGMDGIDVLKQLSQKHPEVIVVVISGYDSFEYVQEAINNGAIKYLLKPIDLDALNELAEKILHMLDERKSNREQLSALRQEVNLNRFDVRSRIFRDFVFGLLPASEWALQSGLSESLHGIHAFRVVIVGLADYANAQVQKNYKKLESWAQTAFMEKSGCIGVYRYENETFALLFAEDTENEFTQNAETLQSLCQEAHRRYALDIAIGVGELVYLLDDIPVSCEQAHLAHLQKKLRGRGVFYAQEAAKTAQNFDLKVTQSSLRQKIDLGHFEDIQASIHRDFEHLRMNSMSCDYLAVQAYMLQYILAFVTACKEYEIPMQDVFQTAQNPFDKLSNLPTLSDMERWLICSCDQLRKFIRTEEMDRTGNIAQEIRAYLRAHLDQCITLNTLAKRYCYSTNYLGQMFKRHTGQSVGEYLTQVRIERAKELLATTNKTIQQIAFECGISDQSYFTCLFRKHTGLSPSRYRKGNTSP